MSHGVEVRLKVVEPSNCPVARASDQSGGVVTSVNRSQPRPDGTVVEEFSMENGGEVDDPEISKFAEAGSESVYRFERPPGTGCVCERIQGIAGPVVDTFARNGALFVTFRARDRSTVQTVKEELREHFDRVYVSYIRRGTEQAHRDPVVMDRTAMTDRQREVLRVAHELGYFDHPKGANASEVAEHLDICRSTFSEHLAAALRKVTGRVVETEPGTAAVRNQHA